MLILSLMLMATKAQKKASKLCFLYLSLPATYFKDEYMTFLQITQRDKTHYYLSMGSQTTRTWLFAIEVKPPFTAMDDDMGPAV